MPGEDEGPPGAPAQETARLEAVASRLETLGLAVQRSIGETTESTATLSRTVGTVSAEVSRLIGDAVTALGKTRQIVLATDDSVGSVVVAFEKIEQRLAEVANALGELVERQQGLEEDRPTAEELGAAVGTEVATALQGLAETFTAGLEQLTAELQQDRAERAALAEQLQQLIEPAEPPLTEAALRAQVESAVEAVVTPAVDELRTAVDSAVEEVAASRDDGALERLRTDLHALGDDLATTAKRAATGQRAVEALQARVEQELPADVERALASAASDIRQDTEGLVSELHDDLALVMRQVVSGNEGLESLRETIAELTAAQVEATEAASPAAEIAPVVRSARDEMMGAVGDLHEDLALVLKRLAASQRELDDVRETILAAAPQAVAPSVDGDALAARVRDELVAPLAEMGDDLSVLVRSLARTQEDIDALRTGLAELTNTVAGQPAAEVEYAEEPVEGPDVAELVDGLRGDIDAGLGAAVSDLRDELDSVRGLVAELAQPLGAGDIRAEMEGLLSEVRDDLALLAQQLVTGQDEVTVMRSELLETLGAVQPAEIDAEAVAAATEDIRAEVVALAEELRGQFERLRTVMGRRVEPAPTDAAAVAAEVAAAVDIGAEVQAVVADLHEDLSLVLGQVVAAQEELQAVREEVNAGQDDVRVVLDALVTGQEELRAFTPAAGVDPDDLRAVIDSLANGQSDIQALREEVAALLEVAGAPPAAEVDLEPLEIAITDLPAVVGAELRAELEAVADDIRARLRQLEALAEEAGQLGGSTDAAALQGIRDEVQAFAGDVQTDLGTVIREVVASHDEVSQLRAEVANVADTVADGLPAPVEDPAIAIEGMRVDVTAGLADLAAELRGDLEALVAELHDDLGTLMRQVVAGQDDLDALRGQLAEVAELAAASGGADQVADDLDRLTRDLQALRDRIPGNPPAPARRRPRAHPGR